VGSTALRSRRDCENEGLTPLHLAERNRRGKRILPRRYEREKRGAGQGDSSREGKFSPFLHRGEKRDQFQGGVDTVAKKKDHGSKTTLFNIGGVAKRETFGPAERKISLRRRGEDKQSYARGPGKEFLRQPIIQNGTTTTTERGSN